MKALLAVAAVFITMTATASADVSQDISDALNRIRLPFKEAAQESTASTNIISRDLADALDRLRLPAKEAALAQDLDDGLDNDDDDAAKAMTAALLGSIMEDGDDGEESIMAHIMNSTDEEDASAQFRFLRRIFRRIRRSRVGRFLGRTVRNYYCRRGK